MAHKPFFFFMLLLCAATMAVGTAAQCVYTDLFVYAYGTLCDFPALYSWRYRLVSASDWSTALAPEWDETNSTFYARLSSTDAATYYFVSKEGRLSVSVFDPLYIVNVDSGRYLGWRDEDGEKFLVELSAGSESVAELRFNQSSFGPLPCILPYPPRVCNPYNILLADVEYAGDPYGVGAYIEDGVTYFKLQSDVFPFVLVLENAESAASGSISFSAAGLKMPTD